MLLASGRLASLLVPFLAVSDSGAMRALARGLASSERREDASPFGGQSASDAIFPGSERSREAAPGIEASQTRVFRLLAMGDSIDITSGTGGSLADV